MTDLVPAQLTSRQGNGVAMPSQPPPMALPEIVQICNMIAGAGDLTPPAYRGKPGAVLLAKLWGDAHGIDLFTAIQNISPIEGKPYVAAEMRVALAVAKGFEFRVLESTREVCALRVTRGTEVLGQMTCRYDDQPRKLKTAKGYDTPWATHPDDMLFAEACRKADRRFVRTAAALLDAGQDYDSGPGDPLVELLSEMTSTGDEAPDVVELEPELEPDPPPPAPQDWSPWLPKTADELVAMATAAGLKPARVGLLKTAQQLGHNCATIDALLADRGALAAVVAELAPTAG